MVVQFDLECTVAFARKRTRISGEGVLGAELFHTRIKRLRLTCSVEADWLVIVVSETSK